MDLGPRPSRVFACLVPCQALVAQVARARPGADWYLLLPGIAKVRPPKGASRTFDAPRHVTQR